MDLDAVQAVGADPLEKRLVVVHQPDHELSLRLHARVDHGVLQIHRLALVVGEHKTDLGMFLGKRIDLAGTCREIVALARSRAVPPWQRAKLILELRGDQRGHLRGGLRLQVNEVARDEFFDPRLDQAIDVDSHLRFRR